MIVIEVKKFAKETIEERFVDSIEDLVTEVRYLQEDDDFVFIRATILSKDYTAGAILSEVGKLTESL